jgi:hypothetical protein
MDLALLQRAFQQHVLSGDPAISARINSSHAVPVTQRLRVYGDAYRLRLVEALAHNYPRLQQLLDDEQFSQLASGYVQAFPSSHPSVRWFGRHLREYVLDQYPSTPALSDLVMWEWSIANAFDAADQAALSADALAVLPPEAWPQLSFVLHPSVQLIETRSNAVAIYRALCEDAVVPAPESEPPQMWLVWRYGLTPRYRSLEADETAALREAMQGRTFEQICDALAQWQEHDSIPVRAITLLKTWIADELLTGLNTAA